MLDSQPFGYAVQIFRCVRTAFQLGLVKALVLGALLSSVVLWRSQALLFQGGTLQIVSSATLQAGALAPDAFATAYGSGLATQNEVAASPQTTLGGTTVTVRDSTGVERAASLTYVSSEQVNFIIPAGTQTGNATVTVRAANGASSTGVIAINAVAPAIFTTNGVVAGFALRVKADGQQTYESLSQPDAVTGQNKAKAIDVGNPGESVYLCFYLTGIRNADSAQVRVFLGGDAYTPVFVGAVSPGLDQINLLLDAKLAGKGLLELYVNAPNASDSNLAQVELGGGVSALNVTGLSSETVLAGQTLEISGVNLPRTGVEVLFSGGVASTPVEPLAAEKLTLQVPYGCETGEVSIKVNGNVLWRSPRSVSVRTSISGVIKDASGGFIEGMTVRLLRGNNSTTTNGDGVFVLPDVTPGLQQIVVQAPSSLSYPAQVFKLAVAAGKDNLFPRVELTETLTPALAVARTKSARVTDIVLELPQCTETNVCPFTLTSFVPGRTPVDLPPGTFSSAIAQITPFGQPISPGGKLRFPNSENLPVGTPLRVFKLDQTQDSPTLGQFLDVGPAVFADNGQTLETPAGAVNQGSYYFISRQWPTATVIGHVVEADGVRPVRRALVTTRGQSVFTDGNGGFVLRNIPVIKAGDAVTLEIASLRPNSTVASTDRVNIAVSEGALVQLQSDIVLLPRPVAVGPTILAPSNLTVSEGETRDFNLLIRGVPANFAPALNGPLFGSLRNLGNGDFALRLAPAAGSAGTYTFRVIAFDEQNNVARQTILVTVLAASSSVPSAQSQSILTNEDTAVSITLTSVNAGNAPAFSILTSPLHGKLSGTPPNVTYTPAANYNGTDSFLYKVGSGTDARSMAEISVVIRPVNDPPVLTVPGAQTVGAGQALKLNLTAVDPDGDVLTLNVLNAPAGATQNPPQSGPNTWQFTWTPTLAQEGAYQLNFRVTDSATPALSDSKAVGINVAAKWAKTSGPEGGIIQSVIAVDSVLYGGSVGSGVYRSTDDGQTWALVSNGLTGDALGVRALLAFGGKLYAGTFDGVYHLDLANVAQGWTRTATGLAGGALVIRALALTGSTLQAGTSDGVYGLDLLTAGASWTKTRNNTGLTGSALTVSALFAANNQLYAGTNDGVYTLDLLNASQSWTKLRNNNGLTSRSVRALLLSETTLYAGTLTGVYRLNLADASQGWQPTNAANPSSTFVVSSLAQRGTTLFAGFLFGGIYRLRAGQTNWERINTGLTTPDGNTGGFYVHALFGQGANIYAGTESGVFRSNNDGDLWNGSARGILAANITSLVAQSGVIYAATEAQGAFRSTDNGQSWKPINAGFDNTELYVFTLFADGANVYAGTPAGVYRFDVNAQRWGLLGVGLEFAQVYSLIASGGILYAGTGNGVYRLNAAGLWEVLGTPTLNRQVNTLATDGVTLYAGGSGVSSLALNSAGAAWVSVNVNLTGLAQNVRTLLIKGGSLFVGGEKGVYQRLLNAAPTVAWTAVNTGLPATALTVGVLVSANDILYVGLGGDGVYRSRDDGQTWSKLDPAFTSSVPALAFSGNRLLAGTFGNSVFLLSDNLQSWSASHANLTNKFVNAVAVKGNSYFAGTLGGGVFRSTDQGATWATASGGLSPSANVQSIVNSGALLFAGTFGQGVYRSADDGGNWAALNAGLPDNTANPQQNPRNVNALRVQSDMLLAATDGGVFRLSNFGGNNTWAATGLTKRTLSLLANGATLYAGTFDDGVYRSTNGGQSWERVSQGLVSLAISALGVSADGASLFAGTDAGIYRSTNQGASWAPVNKDLPANLLVTSFSTSGAKLYAGSVYGVFLSEDNGANWQQLNAGLQDIYVTSLAQSGNTLIAGSKTGGVYLSQIPNQSACVGIAAQPLSKTITAGQTATLSVTPRGDQPFQFQWYRGARGDFSQPIAGATASTFTTPALTATTNYWVLVSNGCGSVNSETAAVILNATPQTDLALTQTITPAQPKSGDTLTVTLTLINAGAETAFGVTVTDALPTGVTYLEASCLATGGGICGGNGNTRTVSFNALAPNATATVTLAAKVNASSGASLRNTASVSANTTDTNLANNLSVANVTVQGTAPIIVSLTPSVALAGSPGFTLVVAGSNFVSNAKVRWNGGERPTTFVSATQLTAQIPATDLSQAGTALITVLNPDGQFSNSASFTINPPGRSPSVVRVGNGVGNPGGAVTVEIALTAQGDENALGVSLAFDPTVLTNPQIAPGSSVAGANFNANTTQAAHGRFGVVIGLPNGARFSAGVQQLALVTFTIAAQTSATQTAVSFSDQPVLREIADANANAVAGNYLPGSVTIARGFEADLAPRPDGDGRLTVSDWVEAGRLVSSSTGLSPSVFQRLDCAPLNTLGNGVISVSDWVQVGRYVAGLDPLTPAGGPFGPTASQPVNVGLQLRPSPEFWRRRVQLAPPVFGAGQTVSVAIELLAHGNENALSFSLQFDPQQWRFSSATAGEDAANAMVRVNDTYAARGRVGLAIALPPGRTWDVGLRSFVMVTFVATEGGGASLPVEGIGDWPTVRAIASVTAADLEADWALADGKTAPSLVNVSSTSFLSEPFAPGAFVSAFGRELADVALSASGDAWPEALGDTVVVLTDSAGRIWRASLLFVSPLQVNYRLPLQIAPGAAEVQIRRGRDVVAVGRLEIGP